MTKGGDPYRARRWREAGTGDAYVEATGATDELDPDTLAGYPATGTVAAVLGWVGSDLDRAAYALGAERSREHPRQTVIDPLAKLVA